MLAATAMMKRHICMELTSLFFSAKESLTSRPEVLARIIRIDIAKIRHYRKGSPRCQSVLDEAVSTVKAPVMASSNSGSAL